MSLQLGVNFLRNRAYAEQCQYDAWNVANNTVYGQWLVNTFGAGVIYGHDAPYFDEDTETWGTEHFAGIPMETSAGYNVPWLLGNSYTDWALAKFASIGLKWIRDWAVVGQWPRLIASAPKTGGVVSGPVVFDADYDWSVLDRMVQKTAELGMKLVLTLPEPYSSLIDPFGWANGVNHAINGTTVNDTVLNYLLCPYAAQLATRYQDYTHIYIDPLNELTYGQVWDYAVTFQRAIYNAVKAALPAGKKDNIKVQMASQFYAEQLAMIHAIGSEHIYDEYIAPHYYPGPFENTFDLSGLQAMRAALDSYGRSDVKIQFGEFGAWQVTTVEASVGAVQNMVDSAIASGLVDSALYWPCVASLTPSASAPGYSVYSTIGVWKYPSFNQSALPDPFAYLEDFAALEDAADMLLRLSADPLHSSSYLSTGGLIGIIGADSLTGVSVLATAVLSAAGFGGVVVADSCSSAGSVSAGGLIGIIPGDSMLGASALAGASLIGVLVADSLGSDAALSEGALVGILAADDMQSSSFLAEGGLSLNQILTGAGSIRSPSGGPLNFYDASGQPLNLMRA